MGRYILALLTPVGRIPASRFLVLLALLFPCITYCHVALIAHLDRFRDPYIAALWGLLVILWMNYCLTSRRLQDAGLAGGMMLAPIFLLTVLWWLALYDPMIDVALVGSDPDEPPSALSKLIVTARNLAVYSWPVIWILSLLAQPNDVENQFGPSWDRMAALRKQSADDDVRSRIKSVGGQQKHPVPSAKPTRGANRDSTAHPVRPKTHLSAPPVREFRRRSPHEPQMRE